MSVLVPIARNLRMVHSLSSIKPRAGDSDIWINWIKATPTPRPSRARARDAAAHMYCTAARMFTAQRYCSRMYCVVHCYRSIRRTFSEERCERAEFDFNSCGTKALSLSSPRSGRMTWITPSARAWSRHAQPTSEHKCRVSPHVCNGCPGLRTLCSNSNGSRQK